MNTLRSFAFGRGVLPESGHLRYAVMFLYPPFRRVVFRDLSTIEKFSVSPFNDKEARIFLFALKFTLIEAP